MKKYLYGALIILTAAACKDEIPLSVRNYSLTAPIYPDYIDVTVPASIAPLDFSYQVSSAGKCVTTFSCAEKSFSVSGRKVRIDADKWRNLLSCAKGNDITVYSSLLDTSWLIHVSEDEIDYGLNYRLIEPSYEIYSKMGIYERELATYKQVPLIENTEYFGCCNCHTHCKGNPANLSLHIRGEHGCTLIMKDGDLTAYNTKTDSTMSACVYSGWHPGGEYLCYSQNLSRQGFHAREYKILEVFDNDGDVTVYDIKRNQMILSDSLMNPNYIESFPNFSADGKYLYFTRSDFKMPGNASKNITDVQYSLCRIGFDAENGKIGDEIETVIDCKAIGQSVCFPKPSPDGKYILYVRSNYGIFASWHPESELYLYNIDNGDDRRLTEVNSINSESCPCWSSDGKWFVFGSRRDDGLFTRPYIAHFDSETGTCGKAFMLPQEDPERYYSSLFFSYNIPEFVTGPMVFNHVEAEKKIHSKERTFFEYRKN